MNLDWGWIKNLGHEHEHGDGFTYEQRDVFAFTTLKSSTKEVHVCDFCGDLFDSIGQLIVHMTREEHVDRFRQFVEDGGATEYNWEEEEDDN